MNYNGQICYNIMVSYFKWRHNTSTGKSPLLSWKVFTWIMVKTCVPYTSYKIHLILKFIEIDETSVKLFHNYSKSDCHKLQKLYYIMLTLFISSTLFDKDYTRIQDYEFTITHFTIQFHLKHLTHFTNLSSLDIESNLLLLLTL